MAYVKVSTTKNVTAALRYGLHEKGAPAHGVNCPDDTETARRLFRADRIMWMKDDAGKLQGHVIIQSFDERDDLTQEEANQLGQELARRVAPGYRAMIYTHGRGPHNHIVIESVNPETGKKLDTSGMLNKCRAISDEICREHGLHIIDGSHPRAVKTSQAEEGMIAKGKAGESWKISMRSAIYDAMQSKSLDEFMQKLKRRGITVNERTRKRDRAKSWTYYDSDGHKCRAAKLGNLFTRERVVEAVEARTVAAEIQAATVPETAKTSTERDRAEPKEKRPLRASTRPSETSVGIPVPPDFSEIPPPLLDEYPPPPPDDEIAGEIIDFGRGGTLEEYQAVRETVEAAGVLGEYSGRFIDDNCSILRDRAGGLYILPKPENDISEPRRITFGELRSATKAAKAAGRDYAKGGGSPKAAASNVGLFECAEKGATAAFNSVSSAVEGVAGTAKGVLSAFDPTTRGDEKIESGVQQAEQAICNTPVNIITDVLSNPITGILKAPFRVLQGLKDAALGMWTAGVGMIENEEDKEHLGNGRSAHTPRVRAKGAADEWSLLSNTEKADMRNSRLE